MLLSLFKNFPNLLCWDKEGHVNFDNEGFDPVTNIYELLEYCLRTRAKVTQPEGLRRFLEFVVNLMLVHLYLLSLQEMNT